MPFSTRASTQNVDRRFFFVIATGVRSFFSLCRFHGSTMVDQVIDAMDYAVYVYDVSHIVLDNLQFMLSGACVAVWHAWDVS